MAYISAVITPSVHAHKKVLRKLMEEWLLASASALLIVTSILLKRIPSYELSDYEVLYVLFVFLVIVKGLEGSGALSYIVHIFERSGNAGIKFVVLTGILSIFVTNDIALLIMVPITLHSGIKNKGMAVIMETLIANSASSISPFGNPQNIFIYYHYGISAPQFISSIAPFSMVSTSIILLFSVFSLRSGKAELSHRAETGKNSWVYGLFFLIFLLSILRMIPLWAGIIAPFYALIWDRKSLKIDYLLIVTFFVFFGLTDNIQQMISPNISSSYDVFLYSALSSQIISNVPSALLFADFTEKWRALLWGVSVGGFGTMIASMANLISYRFYRKTGDSGDFLIKFHMLSFLMLIMGMVLFII